MSKAADRNRDSAPLDKKLDDLYQLIEGIEIAMFTTRRPDGHLVSRPMATQTQAEGSDLWLTPSVRSARRRSTRAGEAEEKPRAMPCVGGERGLVLPPPLI